MDGTDAKLNSSSCLLLSDAMSRLSNELDRAAKDCATLQHLTSSLLEKLHHPDLAAEFLMLQDLDRLHQTLEDLRGLSRVLANVQPDPWIDRMTLENSLHLHSLRSRMFPDIGGTSQDDVDETTWF